MLGKSEINFCLKRFAIPLLSQAYHPSTESFETVGYGAMGTYHPQLPVNFIFNISRFPLKATLNPFFFFHTGKQTLSSNRSERDERSVIALSSQLSIFSPHYTQLPSYTTSNSLITLQQLQAVTANTLPSSSHYQDIKNGNDSCDLKQHYRLGSLVISASSSFPSQRFDSKLTYLSSFLPKTYKSS